MSIPTDFSGLVCWHEAYNDPNADGSTITRLPGVGGMPWGPRGGGASTSTAGARPTVVTLGSGRRAYRFDNTDDCISSAANLSTRPLTVVIMYAAKSTATPRRALSNYWDQTVGNVNNWLIGQRSDTSAGTFSFYNGGAWLNGPALDTDVMHVHSVRQRTSGTLADYRVDGVAIGTAASTNVPNLIQFGGMNFWGEKANADIIGMVAYNVALSDADVASVEAYWATGGGGVMTTAPVVPTGSGHLVMDIDPNVMVGTLANNDPLNIVTDSSTYGNDASQVDSGMMGVFKTAVLNGFPVMEFDGFTPDFSGRGKYLQTPDILTPTAGSTYLALCRRTGAIGEHSVYTRLASLSNPWGANDVLSHESFGGSPSLIGMGNSGIIATPGPALNEWYFYAIVFNSATAATHYMNGPKLGTFNPHADADAIGGVSIGSGEAPTQTARAALYDIALTCWEVWQIMLEWAIKYDLRSTLSSGSGCPGQWGGVTAYTHTLQRGSMRTTVSLGGQPKGGYKRHLQFGFNALDSVLAFVPLPPPEPVPPGGPLTFNIAEVTTILAAGFTDTAIQLPPNSTIWAVSVLVITDIPGPTTGFAVGTAADVNLFQTATVGTAAGSADAGTKNCPLFNATATSVRLSMVGGSPATATGQVRVLISGFGF